MKTHNRGQSLVEMALLAPLLFIVLFGIIEFGHYVYAYNTLYSAVRQGTEQAAKTPPAEGFSPGNPCYQEVVRELASPDVQVLFPNVGNNITLSYPDPEGRVIGARVRIDVVQPIIPLTPLPQLVGLSQITVRASSQRTIESLGIDLTNETTGMACDN